MHTKIVSTNVKMTGMTLLTDEVKLRHRCRCEDDPMQENAAAGYIMLSSREMTKKTVDSLIREESYKVDNATRWQRRDSYDGKVKVIKGEWNMYHSSTYLRGCMGNVNMD